jgi:hypothetical protein
LQNMDLQRVCGLRDPTAYCPDENNKENERICAFKHTCFFLMYDE